MNDFFSTQFLVVNLDDLFCVLSDNFNIFIYSVIRYYYYYYYYIILDHQ